jgi:hypothetical protein
MAKKENIRAENVEERVGREGGSVGKGGEEK